MAGKASTPFIKAGEIVAAHGIRGQVKIRSFTERPQDIASYGPLWDAYGERRFQIRLHGQGKDLLIASLEEVTDRNQAEAMRGTGLFIPLDALPPLTGQNWYVRELIGLSVQNADGAPMGTVSAVHDYGAGDILEIAFSEGESRLFPFRRAFFPEVNTDKGYITFVAPEILE